MVCYAGVVFLNSPIGPARVDRLIRELNFDASQWVLDVGCGTGELLIRIVETHGVKGLGIDRDEEKIAEAQAAARRRFPLVPSNSASRTQPNSTRGIAGTTERYAWARRTPSVSVKVPMNTRSPA